MALINYYLFNYFYSFYLSCFNFILSDYCKGVVFNKALTNTPSPNHAEKDELTRLRDEKGRFISSPSLNTVPLPEDVINSIVGNLLGDGSLRFTHKTLEGKPTPNANASYAMTLKNKEYIDHLWSNIYPSICTLTPPRPNPKTGKPATQYTFSSKSLPSLTKLHSQWYK